MAVIINPRGGAGGARERFESQCRRILELASIELQVMVTTAPQHATELAAEVLTLTLMAPQHAEGSCGW